MVLSLPILETRQCEDVKMDKLPRDDETVPGGRNILADPEEGWTENSRVVISCHTHDGKISESEEARFSKTDLFKINPIDGMTCN